MKPFAIKVYITESKIGHLSPSNARVNKKQKHGFVATPGKSGTSFYIQFADCEKPLQFLTAVALYGRFWRCFEPNRANRTWFQVAFINSPVKQTSQNAKIGPCSHWSGILYYLIVFMRYFLFVRPRANPVKELPNVLGVQWKDIVRPVMWFCVD